MTTPEASIFPQNSKSPIVNSSEYDFVENKLTSFSQGLLSVENARVFPIKIPGVFGVPSGLVAFKAVAPSLYPSGSLTLTDPSNLTSLSVDISLLVLYFFSIKKRSVIHFLPY